MLRYVAVLVLSSVAWADVEIRDNEVWFVQGDQKRQLTHDGKAKLQALLSPGKDRIAYYEECTQDEPCVPSVVVLDLDGKRLQSFQARPQAISPDSKPCASILNIAWVWSGAIGVECHINPSVGEYIEVDLQTGRSVRDLLGLGFTPSPDGKYVAHVGPIVHFAPPFAQSYYLMIDDTTVYPLPKGVKPKPSNQSVDVVRWRGSKKAIGIHEFVPKFFWSPDSSRVAFIDCTFDWIQKGVADDGATPIGDETNRRCSLAVVAVDGKFSLFPFLDTPPDEISWQDDQQIKVTDTKTIRVPR